MKLRMFVMFCALLFVIAMTLMACGNDDNVEPHCRAGEKTVRQFDNQGYYMGYSCVEAGNDVPYPERRG